jgi:hypothetical protein
MSVIIAPGTLIHHDEFDGRLHCAISPRWQLVSMRPEVKKGEFMIVLFYDKDLAMHAVVTSGLKFGYVPNNWYFEMVNTRV